MSRLTAVPVPAPAPRLHRNGEWHLRHRDQHDWFGHGRDRDRGLRPVLGLRHYHQHRHWRPGRRRLPAGGLRDQHHGYRLHRVDRDWLDRDRHDRERRDRDRGLPAGGLRDWHHGYGNGRYGVHGCGHRAVRAGDLPGERDRRRGRDHRHRLCPGQLHRHHRTGGAGTSEPVALAGPALARVALGTAEPAEPAGLVAVSLAATGSASTGITCTTSITCGTSSITGAAATTAAAAPAARRAPGPERALALAPAAGSGTSSGSGSGSRRVPPLAPRPVITGCGSSTGTASVTRTMGPAATTGDWRVTTGASGIGTRSPATVVTDATTVPTTTATATAAAPPSRVAPALRAALAALAAPAPRCWGSRSPSERGVGSAPRTTLRGAGPSSIRRCGPLGWGPPASGRGCNWGNG